MTKPFSTPLLLIILLFQCLSCGKAQDQQLQANQPIKTQENEAVEVGAEQMHEYLPLLAGQSVGLVVNQTSVVNNQHLVDTLLSKGVNIKKVFAPEHGFRGTADAGEKVSNGVDSKTALPIISLYGSNRKPTAEQLRGITTMIFDIQDVGTRFYTYISTLEYVLEACAEQNIPVIILDRPNPNGHYVDGPVLEMKYQSFVGRQQIPVVHGMTVGEYARFLNGEKLLANGIQANLTVITCKNYDHTTRYKLPIAPSPNLPNQKAILLYPSLCFFEGTNVSVGRGTNKQFQIFGAPNYTGNLEFMPVSMPGAKYPKFENELCFGKDLSTISLDKLYEISTIQIQYLINAYRYFDNHNQDFFLQNNFFEKLVGTDQLRQQLKAGMSAEEIRQTWQADIEAFKQIRKQYLLYPDFG